MSDMPPDNPPRTRLNRLVVIAYQVLVVYAPGLLLLWGAQRAQGWLKSVAELGTAVLVLVVLPVYFIYMTLAVRRFHPRGPVRQFLPFAPVLLLAGAYLRPGLGPLRALEGWMMLSLPLFVGFMLALLLGLSALLFRQLGTLSTPGRGLALGILLLGLVPTLYVTALGLQLDVLAQPADPTWALARFAGGIGLVLAAQLGTVRRMYREGRM